MHPRQYDIEARSLGEETSPGSLLNLIVDFFPRKPCGTNVFENTNTPNYAWNFTDETLPSNPFPNFLGANYTKLQRFIARCYVHRYYTTPETIAI